MATLDWWGETLDEAIMDYRHRGYEPQLFVMSLTGHNRTQRFLDQQQRAFGSDKLTGLDTYMGIPIRLDLEARENFVIQLDLSSTFPSELHDVEWDELIESRN